MEKFKKGQFIRWTSTDNEGKFSHTGQVVSHKSGMITFITGPNAGEMGVPEDDGSFELVRKPRNWKETTAPASISKPKAVRKTVTHTRKTGSSKLDLVVDLLRNDPPVDRKDAINKIVAAGISTPAGASTFYNSAKKVL